MMHPVYIPVVLLPVMLCTALAGTKNVSAPAEWTRESLKNVDLEKLPMDNSTYIIPRSRKEDMECQSVHSKTHYAVDFCTTLKPVRSVVCTGQCVPSADIPWYAKAVELWKQAQTVVYACENGVVRQRRVKLICESGETRTITVPVVKTCVCKEYVRDQNASDAGLSGSPAGVTTYDKKHRRRKHKNTRRKGRRRSQDGRRRSHGSERSSDSENVVASENLAPGM